MGLRALSPAAHSRWRPLIDTPSGLTKQALIAEMQKAFGEDKRRIDHALSVLSFAEKILLEEPGDRDVVLSAALLHDIGIREAERKYGSNAARYQEIEGPPIARRILESLGAEPRAISEVCDIIAHHHSPRKDETLNFKILYDADTVVNLRDEVTPKARARLAEKIPKLLLTPTGREVARQALLE